MGQDEVLARIEKAGVEGWRSLDLSGQGLKEIPESIAQLSNLIKLSLVGNQIRSIPESIAQLSNLTTLFLNGNQIRSIPEAIAQLSNLTTFFLSGNQIRSIPEAIVQLSNLTTLYLDSNQISIIPEAIVQLSNLTTLNLSGNQISSIPESIAQLSNLTKLNLGVNQISSIPESIAQLSNLTRLDLTGNPLLINHRVLEKIYLAATGSRKTLDLSNSDLVEIPEVIFKLTKLSNLTELNLSNNQIQKIPKSITQLTNLNKLNLRKNPITKIPVEVLESCDAKEIINYLIQINKQATRPLHEAKLLLVGQGNVGKTSLVKRLLHDTYDSKEPQTDGLEVEPWNVAVNSKEVRLNVWDFGGQEIYHATHQFFLTRRSIYLLVCNCRTSEEENRIEYWLKLIESFGDRSPVIIVGNKRDEQPLDINRKALQEKYPNIQAIIETSCPKGDGITELRTAILEQVADLKEVYDLLPLTWFEVKEHLEVMTEDFISYNKYLNICHTKDITTDQDQEQLIDLLHNLGLVLNYREHPLLRDTSVLKPSWVTEGIYALLSDDTLKTETKGIFTPADLSRLLEPARYPSDRHQYLLDLMKQFELSFALDCHLPRFLIPGLLPKDEPEATNLEGETLEFQYHYRVLPASIMSRFIVLTHEKIHNHTYWRSGVMLEYQQHQETYNIARIRADTEDKIISLTISGRKETQRLFLGILRDVFNKIHNSFANLELTECVPVPNHPDHSPLDYQELLGLESMGKTTVTIGKLKLELDLRLLLNGYEDISSRQRSLRGDQDFDDKYEDMREIAKMAVSRPIEVKAEAKAVSENSQDTYNLQNATVGAFVKKVEDQATVITTLLNKRNLPRLKKCLAALLAAATRQTETKN